MSGIFGSQVQPGGFNGVIQDDDKGLAESLFGCVDGAPEFEVIDDPLLGTYDRRRSSKRGAKINDPGQRQRSSSTYNDTAKFEKEYLKSPISENKAMEEDEGDGY